MLRSTFAIAYRRTARSLAVKPPSLKTGAPKRLVVAISTPMPVSARAFANRSRVAARVASSGTRSSSWKVIAAAPSSARGAVLVKGGARGPEPGEPVPRLHRVQPRSYRTAEDVDALPAHGPEAE